MGIINAKNFEFDFACRDEARRLVASSDSREQERALAEEHLKACESDPWWWMQVHELCFLCHEKLSVPCVFWAGANSSRYAPYSERTQIWLHPACAESLAMRILRDVEELRTGDGEAATKALRAWKSEHPTRSALR